MLKIVQFLNKETETEDKGRVNLTGTYLWSILKFGNPYNTKYPEMHLVGPFKDIKERAATNKRILKNGPREFRDWTGGSASNFAGTIDMALKKFTKANPTGYTRFSIMHTYAEDGWSSYTALPDDAKQAVEWINDVY